MSTVDNCYVLYVDVCQLYSEQRAIRVKRVVDRKRMSVSVCDASLAPAVFALLVTQ